MHVRAEYGNSTMVRMKFNLSSTSKHNVLPRWCSRCFHLTCGAPIFNKRRVGFVESQLSPPTGASSARRCWISSAICQASQACVFAFSPTNVRGAVSAYPKTSSLPKGISKGRGQSETVKILPREVGSDRVLRRGCARGAYGPLDVWQLVTVPYVGQTCCRLLQARVVFKGWTYIRHGGELGRVTSAWWLSCLGTMWPLIKENVRWNACV